MIETVMREMRCDREDEMRELGRRIVTDALERHAYILGVRHMRLSAPDSVRRDSIDMSVSFVAYQAVPCSAQG